MSVCVADCPKPEILKDCGKIFKIIRSSTRGSDLQLYQGPVIELEKGNMSVLNSAVSLTK
jgi:hypothetical protein